MTLEDQKSSSCSIQKWTIVDGLAAVGCALASLDQYHPAISWSLQRWQRGRLRTSPTGQRQAVISCGFRSGVLLAGWNQITDGLGNVCQSDWLASVHDACAKSGTPSVTPGSDHPQLGIPGLANPSQRKASISATRQCATHCQIGQGKTICHPSA